MSATPITDVAERHAYQFDDDMTPVCCSKVCRDLELQLASVTKQRDALAEALDSLMFDCLHYNITTSDRSFVEAKAAMATLKGDNP